MFGQDTGIMTKRMLTAIILLSTIASPVVADNTGYTAPGQEET